MIDLRNVEGQKTVWDTAFPTHEGHGGLIGGWGLVNPAQIGGDGFAVFPGAEVQGMAHQMDDTGLHRGLWKGRRDRLREAFQVHDGDQHVLNV